MGKRIAFDYLQPQTFSNTMNDEKIIGGSWLLTLTSHVVETDTTLLYVSTSLTIVLTSMGIINYILKWRKGKF